MTWLKVNNLYRKEASHLAIYERGREAKIGTYKTQNNLYGRPQGMMSGQKGDLTGQKLFMIFHETKRNETIFNLTRKYYEWNTRWATVRQDA